MTLQYPQANYRSTPASKIVENFLDLNSEDIAPNLFGKLDGIAEQIEEYERNEGTEKGTIEKENEGLKEENTSLKARVIALEERLNQLEGGTVE